MEKIEYYKKLIKNYALKNSIIYPIKLGDNIICDCDRYSYNLRKNLFSNLKCFKPGDRLVDVCSNNGTNSFIINELFPFIEIEGFDIDNFAIKIANLIKEYNNILNINFLVENILNFNYSNFNYILNSGIDNNLNNFISKIDIYRKNGFNGKILLIYNCFDDDNPNIFTKEFISLRKERTLNTFNCEVISSYNNYELFLIHGNK